MQTLFIEPGRLRTEMSLQAAMDVADGMGGFTRGWSEVATVMCLIEPAAQRQAFGAGQTLETYTHRIVMRHREAVASGMRLALPSGRVFDIRTVHDPDESGRYLVCRATEEAT